jgi:carbon storage regulator
MLILRRREGESIRIGDEIEVEIVQIGANKVRVGVRAPEQIRVVRKEVYDVGEENAAASGITPELQRSIVEWLCAQKALNMPPVRPISALTDTSGIP